MFTIDVTIRSFANVTKIFATPDNSDSWKFFHFPESFLFLLKIGTLNLEPTSSVRKIVDTFPTYRNIDRNSRIIELITPGGFKKGKSSEIFLSCLLSLAFPSKRLSQFWNSVLIWQLRTGWIQNFGVNSEIEMLVSDEFRRLNSVNRNFGAISHEAWGACKNQFLSFEPVIGLFLTMLISMLRQIERISPIRFRCSVRRTKPHRNRINSSRFLLFLKLLRGSFNQGCVPSIKATYLQSRLRTFGEVYVDYYFY